MEGIGPLPLGAWIMVISMSVIGAWMFFVLRPYDLIDQVTGKVSFLKVCKLMGMLIPAASGGMISALAVTEFYGLDTIYQKSTAAFFFSMICITVCRGFLFVAESKAVDMIISILPKIGKDDKEDGQQRKED